MWATLGKLAIELAPVVLGYFLGKKKEPETITQPMGSFQPQFDQYYNMLMGIMQGNMPTAVEKLEDRIKKQVESEAGSLMNRTVGRLASQGLYRSGLTALAGRDISAMATSQLANQLANLEYGLYRTAMGSVPALIYAGRQGELQNYQQRMANQQSLWNTIGNLALIGSRVMDYYFGGKKNG